MKIVNFRYKFLDLRYVDFIVQYDENDSSCIITRIEFNDHLTKKLNFSGDIVCKSLSNWIKGDYIQNAFSFLNAQEREWFMTGNLLIDFFKNYEEN